MVNTDEIQVATGSRSLAREQDSKRRSKFFYNLRRSTLSQSQGGPGSLGPTGGERNPPPRPSPVPVSAGLLDDLSRALAILQRVRETLLVSVDPSGEASIGDTSRAGLLDALSASHRESTLSGEALIEDTSRAGLLEALSASHRENALCGHLSSLLARLAEESQGSVPAGGAMLETVAPGGVVAVLDPLGILGRGGTEGADGDGGAEHLLGQAGRLSDEETKRMVEKAEKGAAEGAGTYSRVHLERLAEESQLSVPAGGAMLAWWPCLILAGLSAAAEPRARKRMAARNIF